MSEHEAANGMTLHSGQVEALGVFTLDEMFHRIGSGELSAYAAALALRGASAAALIAGATNIDARSKLLLDGQPNKGVSYCAVCKPFPGDEILAVSSFAGAKVHRIGCPKKVAGRASNDVFIPSWANRLSQPLPVRVALKSVDRKGLLADCARVISECGINVIAVNTVSGNDSSGFIATLEFTMLVRSRARLERCLVALASVNGVNSATRPLHALT